MRYTGRQTEAGRQFKRQQTTKTSNWIFFVRGLTKCRCFFALFECYKLFCLNEHTHTHTAWVVIQRYFGIFDTFLIRKLILSPTFKIRVSSSCCCFFTAGKKFFFFYFAHDYSWIYYLFKLFFSFDYTWIYLFSLQIQMSI